MFDFKVSVTNSELFTEYSFQMTVNDTLNVMTGIVTRRGEGSSVALARQ